MRIYEVWGMFKIGKFGKKVVSAVIAGAVVLGTLAVYPSETAARPTTDSLSVR